MWQKQGLLLKVSDIKNEFIQSHASIPFAFHVQDSQYRIFFSSRDKNGKSLPYYINCEIAEGLIQLTGAPQGPFMDLGELGTFDDSGIMPTCVLRHNGLVYMYYIGWNPQVTVSYRLAIGLAISEDDGETFKRYSKGPVCDRTLEEPFFNTAPFVIRENGIWRMWYISCTRWQILNNYPEPSYHVKYAESTDGIHWKKDGTICLDYDERAQALGRPCVIKEGDIYNMFFSFRKTGDYRTTKGAGYQIGLATSADGKVWQKKYDETGISLSEVGWDDKMMEYCHVFKHQNRFYMLYNGNDFGKEGFGYAVADKLGVSLKSGMASIL
jgi:hypothetical protein